MARSILNIRPQHPAVHEVLRLVIEVDREFVVYVNPEIDYLHKETKKLCKYNKYYKITPFFDKFNYVSLLICKHSYILAVKILLEEVQRWLVAEFDRVRSVTADEVASPSTFATSGRPVRLSPAATAHTAPNAAYPIVAAA